MQIGGKEYDALLDTGSNTSIFGHEVEGGQKTGTSLVSFATQQKECTQLRFEANSIRINGCLVGVPSEGYSTKLSTAIPGFPSESYQLLVGTNLLRGLCVQVGRELPLTITKFGGRAEDNWKEDDEQGWVELEVTSCESGDPLVPMFGPLLLVKTTQSGYFLVDTGNSFSTFCNEKETSSSCPDNLSLVVKSKGGVGGGVVPIRIKNAVLEEEPISMKVIQNCKKGDGNVRGNVGVDVWAGAKAVGEGGTSEIVKTRFCFAETKDGHKIFCELGNRGR